MKIRFDDIPDEGLRLSITDSVWFPDDEITRTDSVSASVFFERKGRDRVLLEGVFATTISLDCDRCLESFPLPLDIKFAVDFELPGRDPVSKEHCCGSNEMDTIVLAEPVIDVFDVLEQQAFLAVPMKKLCSEECLGLCLKCGKNLNRKQCLCDKGPPSSPFAVLKNLK